MQKCMAVKQVQPYQDLASYRVKFLSTFTIGYFTNNSTG